MMRSLFAGTSGLQNHQIRMDVIGNNIANVNTTGFKKNRVNFQDIFYQNNSGAAPPTDTNGGINPKQVGLGMSVASIDTIHTQGSMESTGVVSDLAIQGDGFFVLKDNESSMYTRDGVFGVDAQGTLVSPANGFRVQGWVAQENNGITSINTSSTISDISIPMYGKMFPKETNKVDLASNLDKNLPIIPPGATADLVRAGTWTMDKTIYDSFGSEHTLRIDLVKALDANNLEIPNTWIATVTVDPNSPVATNTAVGIAPGTTNIGDPNTFTVQFDNNGALIQATDQNGNNVANTVDVNGLPIPGVNLSATIAYDVPNTTVDGAGAQPRQLITLDIGDIGDASDSLTQDASNPTSKAVRQDGYTLGYLTKYQIDPTGLIRGVYDNGVTRELGKIAMATFTNAGGLEKNGDVNFLETPNSGEARVGEAATAGKGIMRSGALEMSNVDLAQEFVDMITTQRGFQANSRTIQTSDQMLQELLTLKR